MLAAGIELVNIRLCPFWVPKKSLIVQAVEMVRKWEGPGFIMFKCYSNVDRTGVGVFAERVLVEGWSVDKAITEMIGRGFHARFWWWLYVVERWFRG
jgi:hypothetical protein